MPQWLKMLYVVLLFSFVATVGGTAAVYCLQWFYLNQPTPSSGETQAKKHQTTTEEHSNSQPAEQKSPASMPPPEPQQADDQYAIASESHHEGNWYASPDWWVAIFTGSLFVATAGLWLFTALLWSTTRRAVDDGEQAILAANSAVAAANRHADETAQLVAVTQETAEWQLRAYVMVESAVVKNLQEGREPSIIVVIKNFGQTPAYEATTWFGPGWDKYPPTIEPPPFASDAHPVKHPIGPGGRTEMNMVLPVRLTQRHVMELNNREVAIYATGQVRYQDVFHIARITEFRLYANGPANDGVMGATEKGNFSN